MHNFIDRVKSGAIQGQKEHNVLASITIAQAILESDWGRSELALKANNLFGIKADENWTGDKYNKSSKEWEGGKSVDRVSAFRKYSSWEESIKDHAKFFTSTSWRANIYADILKATDYRSAAKALGDSPYATDPKYGEKILKVIEDNKLYEFDKGVDSMAFVKTICIDPGHGGHDPGATGHGLREKDVVLNISKKLGEKLIAQGFKVVYTRTSDTFVALTDRANMANLASADLFVSVHCNSHNSNALGFETFHFPTATEGRKVAQLVQDEISKNTNLYQVGAHKVNRGVKSAYFTVLTNTAMDAILVETAFISNQRDNQILRDHQDGFAEAICTAICKYYGVDMSKATTTLPTPIDIEEEPHWAEKHFDSLNDKGITVHEKRFDDKISRGEVMALTDRATDLK